jgi:hypothetical protein
MGGRMERENINSLTVLNMKANFGGVNFMEKAYWYIRTEDTLRQNGRMG